MSTITLSEPPKAKQKTTKGQWIAIGLIIAIFIVLWIILWFALVNRLFTGSTGDAGPTPGCIVSGPPTNLVTEQWTETIPSILLSWDPVLDAETQGEIVLGYNVYINETPEITKDNTSALRSETTSIPLTMTENGNLVSGVEIFMRVSTVDTCGDGALGGEVSFTPI